MRRLRVERSLSLDAACPWLILDFEGDVVGEWYTWAEAYAWARSWAMEDARMMVGRW